jgi:hypothetical protein
VGVIAAIREKARGARDTLWAGKHAGDSSQNSEVKIRTSCTQIERNGAPRAPDGSTVGILDEMDAPLTTLYRPVGQSELDLIRASRFREFPPRLPQQPIFYPVLTEEYATQIARDWNTRDERSGFVGYVLRFKVRAEFLAKYDVHVVGSAEHRDFWIPAEDLPGLNANVVGQIEIVSEFHGR